MAEPLLLNVFGCPAVRMADGEPVHFRTKKHLALFVYLALEARDRAVSRETLVELLWSDTDPLRGRHSLSQAFSAMRYHFGRNVLTRGRGPVQLLATVVTELDWIDEHSVPDLQLLRPLDDLEVAGGSAFSHWVDGIRQTLNRRATTSLEAALADAANAGRVDRVREHAAQLYRIDPLNAARAGRQARRHRLTPPACESIRGCRWNATSRLGEPDQPHPPRNRKPNGTQLPGFW
jgi:DNA-binding SARP family transcriptional activator